ncbi:MAG: hypothetical protein AAF567_26215 [Actinomycetota bacterium]
MNRYIDGATTKFMGVLIGVSVGLMVIIAAWVGLTTDGRQFPYLNVAFVVSWIVAILSLVPVIMIAKRRPADKVATWGESMVGATYVFFILFWIYGTVPHQWLTYAESELDWRSSKLLIGPRAPWDETQGILEWALPFTLTYTTVKDLIAVVIYGVGLVANVAMFVIWQKRGDMVEAPALESSSRYGRPLVKAAERTEAKAGV